MYQNGKDVPRASRLLEIWVGKRDMPEKHLTKRHKKLRPERERQDGTHTEGRRSQRPKGHCNTNQLAPRNPMLFVLLVLVLVALSRFVTCILVSHNRAKEGYNRKNSQSQLYCPSIGCRQNEIQKLFSMPEHGRRMSLSRSLSMYLKSNKYIRPAGMGPLQRRRNEKEAR